MPYFAGGAVDQALAAGQCEFVFGAGGVGPLLQGVDVVLVAVTLNQSPLEVWGRKPLKSLADLKGKSVGTSGAGSLSWRVGRFYVQRAGLTPDKDVAILATGDNVSTVGALVSGRVDAAVLTFPFTLQAQNQGMVLLYKPTADLEFTSQGLATTRHYMDQHRNVVKGAVKALMDALTKLKADSNFYGTELKKYTHIDVDAAALQQYWKSDTATYSLPPLGTHKGAVTALSLYSDEAKGQSLDQVADRWLDPSIVNELVSGK